MGPQRGRADAQLAQQALHGRRGQRGAARPARPRAEAAQQRLHGLLRARRLVVPDQPCMGQRAR